MNETRMTYFRLCRGWFIWVPHAILIGWFAAMNFFSPSVLSQERTDRRDASEMSKTSLPIYSGIALDGPIDPDQYVVGAGDVLSVGIWGSVPANLPIQVSMEGTAIIPTVGEVHVAGLTLTKAKSLIVAEVRNKYVVGEITATLVAPRTFFVTVTGYVATPGLHKVYGGSRVATVLQMAQFGTDTMTLRKAAYYESRFSRRHIEIHRGNLVIPVDLVKYAATGDVRHNPLLSDGDRVFVPRIDRGAFVSIWGAVTLEGSYEFVDGDSLSHLLRFAGGPLETADLEHLQISRLAEDGSLKETITANAGKLLLGKAPDVKLETGDRIFLPTRTVLRRDYKIFVDGEVKYKGMIPIAREGTKLSEILKQVGLKEYSSLDQGYVVRNVRYENVEDLFPYLLRKNFALSQDDSVYFGLEAGLLSLSKFVSINLKDVFEGKADLDLYDQDYIFIPSKTQEAVYVFGQVANPGFILHQPGRDYRYYVTQAGGFGQRAREGDVMVIKHKTYSWVDAGKTSIEPGDFVFVTKKVIRPGMYYWALTKDIILTIGAVASTVATIILIAQSAGK